MSLTRQIRREQFKKQLKEMEKQHKTPAVSQIAQSGSPQGDEELQHYLSQIGALVKDVEKIARSVKLLDNHLYMIIEALSDKGLLAWADVHAVEGKFLKREEVRKEKIRELRQTDKSIEQILEEIQDSPNAKKYEMLNIHPIKDINLNPFEVAEALKTKYPNLPDSDYLDLGKRWDLSPDHFCIAKDKENP